MKRDPNLAERKRLMQAAYDLRPTHKTKCVVCDKRIVYRGRLPLTCSHSCRTAKYRAALKAKRS